MIVYQTPAGPVLRDLSEDTFISDAFLAEADPRWVTRAGDEVRLTDSEGASAVYGLCDHYEDPPRWYAIRIRPDAAPA